MKIKSFFFFFIITLLSCNSVTRLYVNYGAEQKAHGNDPDVIRLYFDRVGYIYPDAEIDDKVLRKRDSRLEEIYDADRELYNRICMRKNITPYQGDWDSITAYKDPLQGALVKEYIERINARSEDKIPVFIIHGFNEHPSEPDEQNSSFAENRATAVQISNTFSKDKFEFIEVYWDGLSAENGTPIFSATNSIKIWNNSQASATFAGLELRRILSKLNAPKIYVITHSHGAGVITNALFNVIKFPVRKYEQAGHWLNDIKYNRFSSEIYNTPTQQVYIGMLAPAIPGQNVFGEYYWRTVNGANTETFLKNYHFIIGFNANDPVTSKGYILARKIGATTLASKRRELRLTKKIFNYDIKVIDDVDLSRQANGRWLFSHSWLKYMDNQPFFEQFLQKMFPGLTISKK